MKTEWKMKQGSLQMVRFNNGYVIVGIIGKFSGGTMQNIIFEIKAPLYLMEDPDDPASDALYNFNQNAKNTVVEFRLADIFTVQEPASHIENGYMTLAAAILKGPTDLWNAAELETQKILGKILKK